MPSDFIFGQTPNESFSTLRPEFTNHFNPEVARRQGYQRGAVELNEQILNYIKTTFKRPSKQMQELVTELEELRIRLNDE